MLAHDVAEHEDAVHVVFIVLQRFGHRLAHSLEAGEVDDGINLVVGEDLVHGGAVADVGFDEGHLLADNLLDAAYGFGLRVHKVVHDHNAVACLVQLYKGVAADVAGATSKQNVHIVKGLDS